MTINLREQKPELIRELAGMFVVALGFRLLFCFYFGPLITPDSSDYDSLGYNITQGNGYSTDAQPPFSPHILRPPGYPLFLSAIYLTSGHNLWPVILVQAMIGAIGALLTYATAQWAFNSTVAKWSGWIVTLNPALAYYSAVVLTETLSVFLVLLGLLLFVKGLDSTQSLFHVLAGAVFGLMSLTRANLLFIPVCLLIAAIPILKQQHAIIKVFSALVIPWLVVVGIWLGRNYLAWRYVGLSVSIGFNLMQRTADLRPPSDPSEIVAMMEGNLERLLESRALGSESKSIYRMLAIIEVERQLRSRGYPLVNSDPLFWEAALEQIHSDPIGFAVTTVRELAYLWAGYTPHWAISRPVGFDPGKPPDWSMLILAYCLGIVLFSLTLLGCVIQIRCNLKSWLFISPILYISFSTPLLILARDRYRLPVEPLILTMCVVGGKAIVRFWSKKHSLLTALRHTSLKRRCSTKKQS